MKIFAPKITRRLLYCAHLPLHVNMNCITISLFLKTKIKYLVEHICKHIDNRDFYFTRRKHFDEKKITLSKTVAMLISRVYYYYNTTAE